MKGVDCESGLLLSCRHFIGGSSGPLSLSFPFSSSCLYRFKVHEISMSIDLPPLIFFLPHSFFFFFTPQIFEILISGVSEFLGDEIASSETAGNKMKKLAPCRRAPALSVLWKPHFTPPLPLLPYIALFLAQIRLEIQSIVIVQN